MHSRPAALACCALALGAGFTLTGCSSTSSHKSSSSSTSASKAVTPADRLAAAKKVLDSTSGVHLKLTSTDFPKNVNGVTGAEGDGTHAPAFKGNLNAQLGPISASVPVVATGGKVWAKLPIWPSMRTINPADYGAPDPARLFSTGDGSVSSLLTKTKNPSFGNKLRSGSDVVQQIKGTLAGQDVVSTFGVGQKSQSYDVVYDVTDDNRVVDVQLDGVFAGSTKSTYELALSKYGEKIDIKAP